MIEHPDHVWMAETLEASGALYKAECTGDYSYRGDDPDAYDEVFDQEAGKDNADLTLWVPEMVSWLVAVAEKQVAGRLSGPGPGGVGGDAGAEHLPVVMSMKNSR